MNLRSLFAAVAIVVSVPASAQALKALPNGVEVGNATATLRVTALTDGIVRVRIARGGAFAEDASWAVPRDVRMKSVAVRATADGFATGAMAVHIDPATLGLTVIDPAEMADSNAADLTPGAPIRITNLRLHSLTGGTRYDLDFRRAL